MYKLKYKLVSAAFLAFLAAGFTMMVGNLEGQSNQLVTNNAARDKKLIKDLASEDPRIVMNALEALENETQPGTNVLLVVRKLLPDPRPSIREKAARTLGVLHAEVDKNDIKAICFMLKSYDQREADEALKALRDLKASESVPEIIPLLKNSHTLLVRDACRTLAVLGNTNIIPLIEPLLKDSRSDVRNDAQNAINNLSAKNNLFK